MAEPSMIVVRNVSQRVTLGGEALTILQGIDLEVKPAETVALVGASGSGKSTLLSLLAGLDRASEGEIEVAGVRLDALDEEGRARLRAEQIGFIFQSFNLMPYYTALENVALPLSFSGVPLAQRTKRAKQMLDIVGLSTHMKHRPSELSGGQQQRVGIARALVTNPSIVFADEPTGNLDSNTSEEVMQVIINIMREQKKTLVMVTHDSHIAEFGDTVVHLLDGRITDITTNAKDSTTLNEPRVRETEGILNA